MNKTNQYFTRGLWIFTLMIAGMLVLLYAIQTENTTLLFICITFCFILALGLLLLLLQANKKLGKNQQEILRLEQRVNAMMQNEQKVDDNLQHQETFNCDEILAKIMPAAEKNATAYSEKVLRNIAKELDIVQGLVFVLNDADQLFHISGEYAYFSEEQPRSFPLGETLSGQVAKNRKLLSLNELPEGYITVLSGLGKSAPHNLIIAPIVHGDESIGVLELASFKPFGENEETLVGRICETMAELLNELRS
jgi:transcriptional regulator with GAF, ATPase, and Fis domain